MYREVPLDCPLLIKACPLLECMTFHCRYRVFTHLILSLRDESVEPPGACHIAALSNIDKVGVFVDLHHFQAREQKSVTE